MRLVIHCSLLKSLRSIVFDVERNINSSFTKISPSPVLIKFLSSMYIIHYLRYNNRVSSFSTYISRYCRFSRKTMDRNLTKFYSFFNGNKKYALCYPEENDQMDGYNYLKVIANVIIILRLQTFAIALNYLP